MDEFSFIAALRRIATHPAARGLADDAAVIEFGGEALVITHDAMVEGVHWLPSQDMADVAWKLVAVNLSDLAAKGAEPVGVVLGYTLGPGDARFLDGLEEALGAFGVPVLGGDTVSGEPPRTIGSPRSAAPRTVRFRHAQGRGLATRSGCPGPVGAALGGYEALAGGSEADSTAYRRPVPLLSEGRALAPWVTAMMDVSDGVLLDASRLARASRVTIDVDTAAVPIALPEDRRADALRWGDDYQLLFTLPDGARPPVPAQRIGTVAAAGAAPLLLDGEAPAHDDRLGFRHGG